jgi:predicted aminopeptidase
MKDLSLKTKFNLFFKIAIVVTMLLLNTGCQIPYILESAWTHLKIISSKKDIESALKDPDLPEEWKTKLQIALDVRPYIKSIGLRITKNYQSFVDLKRPYVSHLLIVAPAYSLKPKKWWFPIVGSFPYKGFHSEKKAERAAKEYEKDNMDTYVRGVTAYSTLGWFNDPILSTMMRYSEEELVETIIHESVHATIFIKDNVDFNEQLAMFIAKKATLKYYKEKSDEMYKKIIKEQRNEDIFADYLMASYKKIKKFYKIKENRTPELKAKLFEDIKDDYKKEFVKKISDRKYDFILKQNLNNAYFAAQRTYHMNQKKFEVVFEKDGKKDITTFIKVLKKLSSNEIKKLFDEED